jgi:hypothetical protein
MATPGTLRLLLALDDGDLNECVPRIDEGTGAVSYPTAADHLDSSDGTPIDVLESLARRGILNRVFEEKVYRCPDCGAEGMGYTTACPACESPYTVETELLEHTDADCGHIAPRNEFETRGEYGEYVCPACETALPSFDINTSSYRRYVCRDCDEQVERPADRLRCRDCDRIVTPRRAIERVCCRYSLTDTGHRWVESHRRARDALTEMLDAKGFEVSTDTTVTGPAGNERPVHIYAADELLDDRVVAAIGEWPDADTVSTLRTAARGARARSLLVTTSGSIGTDAASLATESDVALLRLREDGTLERDYETGHEPGERTTLFQRLTSAVRGD